MIQYFPNPYQSFQNQSDLCEALVKLTQHSLSSLNLRSNINDSSFDSSALPLLQSLALSSFLSRLPSEQKDVRLHELHQQLIHLP